MQEQDCIVAAYLRSCSASTYVLEFGFQTHMVMDKFINDDTCGRINYDLDLRPSFPLSL